MMVVTIQIQNKSPPKPMSGRHSKDFTPSSSRSYKKEASPKCKETVHVSVSRDKDTKLHDDEKTEVTFNPSESDDTEVATPTSKGY